MRHLLTLPALTLALAACSTHVPQSPAQPPVVVTPTLPACQLVTVRALGGSTLITPVTEGERPTIRVVLPDGGSTAWAGRAVWQSPPQGLNLAGTVQVEERRPGGFVRCR